MVELKGLEISNLVETVTRDCKFLSFDVSLSGHLISTITVRHQGGSIVWSQASIYGFEDFDSDDRQVMERKIRKRWPARERQAALR